MKYCKGCTVRNVCHQVFKQQRDPACPCIMCLVKVMCGQMCEDYRKFWRNNTSYKTFKLGASGRDGSL